MIPYSHLRSNAWSICGLKCGNAFAKCTNPGIACTKNSDGTHVVDGGGKAILSSLGSTCFSAICKLTTLM